MPDPLWFEDVSLSFYCAVRVDFHGVSNIESKIWRKNERHAGAYKYGIKYIDKQMQDGHFRRMFTCG